MGKDEVGFDESLTSEVGWAAIHPVVGCARANCSMTDIPRLACHFSHMISYLFYASVSLTLTLGQKPLEKIQTRKFCTSEPLKKEWCKE